MTVSAVMETDMHLALTDWSELAKTLGPYAVAVIAIVGTFISAGLAQRNWQKQFGAQQSIVLLNKRLELAEHLPSTLFEAVQRGSSFLLKARISETLNILNSEGRQFPQKTIDDLLKGQEEEARAFENAMGEALKLFFLTKAFFNNEIGSEVAECLSAMQQLNQSQEVASTFRNDLKQSVAPGTTVEQGLERITNVVNGHIKPISTDLSARIGKLARLMVDYAKPNT